MSSRISTLNEQLKCELDHLRKQQGFPGATVAYVLSDGTVGEVASGFADIETKEPMTTKSRMLAGSIGKTFVAATVISLAKESRLNLDAPLSRYLGERRWYSRLPNHETITLRRLLTHSSGIPNHVFTTSFQQSFSQIGLEADFSPESLIEYILDQPPLFEAGKGWAYTDTGYILLGLVIETVVKDSYYEELKRRFLKPLKLDMTSPSDRLILPGLVAGYTAQDNVFHFHLPRKTVDESGSMVWNPIVEWTGGGLISTSRDLAVWAKLLYEGHAMQFDYLADLFQSVPVGDEDSQGRYGAGVFINEKDPLGKQLGHGGIIPGYVSSMRYYPKYGVAVAFQINTDSHFSDFVSIMERRVAEIVIRQDRGITSSRKTTL